MQRAQFGVVKVEAFDLVEILLDQLRMIDQRRHDHRFAERHHAAGAPDQRRTGKAFRNGEASSGGAAARPLAALPDPSLVALARPELV